MRHKLLRTAVSTACLWLSFSAESIGWSSEAGEPFIASSSSVLSLTSRRSSGNFDSIDWNGYAQGGIQPSSVSNLDLPALPPSMVPLAAESKHPPQYDEDVFGDPRYSEDTFTYHSLDDLEKRHRRLMEDINGLTTRLDVIYLHMSSQGEM